MGQVIYVIWGHATVFLLIRFLVTHGRFDSGLYCFMLVGRILVAFFFVSCFCSELVLIPPYCPVVVVCFVLHVSVGLGCLSLPFIYFAFIGLLLALFL